MRTCAVCGKNISKRDICNACFHKWGNGGEYPSWLRDLIKQQKHFETTKAASEEVFSEAEEILSKI